MICLLFGEKDGEVLMVGVEVRCVVVCEFRFIMKMLVLLFCCRFMMMWFFFGLKCGEDVMLGKLLSIWCELDLRLIICMCGCWFLIWDM